MPLFDAWCAVCLHFSEPIGVARVMGQNAQKNAENRHPIFHRQKKVNTYQTTKKMGALSTLSRKPRVSRGQSRTATLNDGSRKEPNQFSRHRSRLGVAENCPTLAVMTVLWPWNMPDRYLYLSWKTIWAAFRKLWLLKFNIVPGEKLYSQCTDLWGDVRPKFCCTAFKPPVAGRNFPKSHATYCYCGFHQGQSSVYQRR